MAQKKYTAADLNRADLEVQSNYKMVQALKNTDDPKKKEVYRQYLKAYQKSVAARKVITDAMKNEKTVAENKKTIKDLQGQLDEANATGDTTKATELAIKIQKAKGIPLDIEGKPMPGYEPKKKPPVVPPKTEGETPVVKDKTPVIKDTGTKGTGTGGKGTDTKGTGVKAPTDAEERAAALENVATGEFTLPETLFNNVDDLKKLLNAYVTSDKNGGQWTLSTFRQKLRDTNWYKNNSAEIKARYVQLYNYRDQLKGGQDVSNTDYAKQISTLERNLANKARKMGSGLASDPAALRKAAENMYLTNVGIDDAMTNDFIAAAIRPITSKLGGKVTEGYSGEALKDYQAIQAIAKANGFKISDILPGGANEVQVLQGLAKGTIDADRLAQDARKLAAQGQPQYVRDLLGQGYNLDQVYAPYKQTMAAILEVNPDKISLNDQTLRSAITDKGDMNMYDFKKALKADKRWQYTEQAREEVSNATLKVLRDFGFQG